MEPRRSRRWRRRCGRCLLFWVPPGFPTCPKTYHLFPAAEGGGEHCQEGVMSRLHQVVFDWLDTVLDTASTVS